MFIVSGSKVVPGFSGSLADHQLHHTVNLDQLGLEEEPSALKYPFLAARLCSRQNRMIITFESGNRYQGQAEKSET